MITPPKQKKTITKSFAGKIFKKATNFHGLTFSGKGGDFENVIFEGPVCFDDATFIGKKVDFRGAVFLADASFKNAKFGKYHQRLFGEWKILFSPKKSSSGKQLYTLKTRKNDEIEREWEEIADFYDSPEPNFSTLLKTSKLRGYWQEISTAFNEFSVSPHFVSFADCRFGEMRIDRFSEEEIRGIIAAERTQIEKELTGNTRISDQEREVAKKVAEEPLMLFENKYKENKFAGLSSELEKTAIMYILAKHLEPANLRGRCLYKENQEVVFAQTSFYPQGDVNFERTLFLIGKHVKFGFAIFGNDMDVEFKSAIFGNGKDVWFNHTCFENGRDVIFDSVTLSNGGDVFFGFAIFDNDRDVEFKSTFFGNDQNVWFFYACFENGRNLGFDSVTFGNGGLVGFNPAKFSNKGEINLSKIVWVNGDALTFSTVDFGETLSVKFKECLFLCGEDISFKEARFPEKGSLMFQRCYFGRTPSVNFTGAFFRHTSFEGGNIFWLDKENRTPEQILKERLGEKYDSLPAKTKAQLNTRTTPVFEEGTLILWQDLTTESAKNLTLRRVNLSHSIFDGMTLSHIQLNAPKWLEKGGRRMLCEETMSGHDIGTLENVEDQYTQLKNNLEKQGNYLNAGYFHYGEQEIRRKILWKRKSYFHWLLSVCYKILSGYGERPWWALVTTLFSILLFSFILILLDGTSLTFLPEVLVEVITPFSWKGSESLKDTLTNAHGIDLLRIYLLIVFQVLFLGIQLPLLVLAVRRRFKR